MRYLPDGKDQIYEPCIELDNGKVVKVGDLLVKLLQKNPALKASVESP